MSSPVQKKDRIISLDVLRGFALLGILIMNIRLFAMPEAAYSNPTVYGDLTGVNRLVWMIGDLFYDMKMMNLFAMLYGAGIILLTERLEQRGEKSISVHYRRTFWLLIIGLAHAYLLWSGDILVTYALTALIVVWFRKRRPRTLIIVAILFLAISSFIMLGSGLSVEFMAEEQAAELIESWEPTPETVSAELEAYRGSWQQQNSKRFPTSLEFQTIVFFTYGFWRSAGLMLIGMALYKWGVLSAKCSRRTYRLLTVIGLGLGLAIVGYGLSQIIADDFSFNSSRFGVYGQFNYWGSLLVSLGYIGAICLIVLCWGQNWFTNAFAAVGRMALTNYLLQTIIATLIFYGHGFGRFGHVERTGQLLITLAIWAFQLVFSQWWLSRFRFGFFEWVWRSLTYWKIQPLTRRTA